MTQFYGKDHKALTEIYNDAVKKIKTAEKGNFVTLDLPMFAVRIIADALDNDFEVWSVEGSKILICNM